MVAKKVSSCAKQGEKEKPSPDLARRGNRTEMWTFPGSQAPIGKAEELIWL